MVVALLIVVCLGLVFVIGLQLVVLLQIHKLKEAYAMTTAELIALLDASNDFTTEIATDLDALIEAVNNSGTVDPEVAAKATALRDKLTEAAAKFTV